MSTKKAEARERVKAMREEQARKDRRRDQLMKFGIVAAVLVGVAIIAIAVVASRGSVADPEAQPPGVSEPGGGWAAVEPINDEIPTVEVWFDYNCPHCKSFEESNGDFLLGTAESGEANLVYRPVTFVGTVANSQRAANAWACSLDEGMGLEYMDAIYELQPNYQNSALIDAARGIGLDSGEFRNCVNNGDYDGWVASSMDVGVSQYEVRSTPTVFVVSGDERNLVDPTAWDQAGLEAAIQAASGSAEE